MVVIPKGSWVLVRSFLEHMAIWSLLEGLHIIAESLLFTIDMEICQLVVPPDALFKLLPLIMLVGLVYFYLLTALLSKLPCKSNFVDCRILCCGFFGAWPYTLPH